MLRSFVKRMNTRTELIYKHIQKWSPALLPRVLEARRDQGEQTGLLPTFTLSSGHVAPVCLGQKEWLSELLYLRRLTRLEGPETDRSPIQPCPFGYYTLTLFETTIRFVSLARFALSEGIHQDKQL